MIPRPVLAAWRARSPWPNDLQVEQDLLLSALAIGVANHPRTGGHLVWRGGTCLHKLHLDVARRYSEDLDYILHGQADHGDIARALAEVAESFGLEAGRRQVTSSRVNVWATTTATTGGTITVKFEVNCADAEPLLELARIPHEVVTRWWNGSADVLTFDPCELVATKFRALAQRRKGRDLSDLWLARRELDLDEARLAAAADHYLKHESISPAQLRLQLAGHARDREFRNDLDVLAAIPYEEFDASVEIHRLILWSDTYLDPLFDARRNPKAVRRDQQQWEKHGWSEQKSRCPAYDETDGNLSRCVTWLSTGERCPHHPDQLNRD